MKTDEVLETEKSIEGNSGKSLFKLIEERKGKIEERDLVLGDFVLYKNKRFEVKEIGFEFATVENGLEGVHCQISMLDPICITDELLLKIGLKLNCGIYFDCSGQIAIKAESSKMWNLSVNTGIQDYEKRIFYLHQLQHELHDVGIDLKMKL